MNVSNTSAKFKMSQPHAADAEYLVRQAMNTGYQWSSLLVPPAYIAYILITKRGRTNLSVNKVLRATWIGGFCGTAMAGGAAYLRYAYSSQESVRVKRIETAYNTSIVRRNDHSIIGSVLGAVAVPAILWNRASIVNLILGGAGVGGGIGLLTHYGRIVFGDHPPQVDIILPVSGSDSQS